MPRPPASTHRLYESYLYCGSLSKPGWNTTNALTSLLVYKVLVSFSSLAHHALQSYFAARRQFTKISGHLEYHLSNDSRHDNTITSINKTEPRAGLHTDWQCGQINYKVELFLGLFLNFLQFVSKLLSNEAYLLQLSVTIMSWVQVWVDLIVY